MRAREQANGIAYIEHGNAIVFPHGDVGPYLIWHGQTVRIERPERFGLWATDKQRRAFMRTFVAALSAGDDR